jgi:hypothetical protein
MKKEGGGRAVRHGARQTGKINKLRKERKNKKREHAAESGTGVELKKFLGNLFGSRSQEGECDGLDGKSGGGRGWRRSKALARSAVRMGDVDVAVEE